MAWETRSIYEIAVFFLSATQLISDHGTEELWGIQSIFRGEFHSILLGQYNNQIIIRQHCKRILEYFLYCLREDFGQSALDELYYADMHDNEHNVLAYSMTMRVRSNSLLESFYSKKLGGGWGKGWTCSSFLSLCSKTTALRRNLLVCVLLLEFGLHWFCFFSCFYVPLCSNNFKLHYVMPFFYFTAWFWFLKEFLYILRWHCSIFPGIFWTFCSVLQT